MDRDDGVRYDEVAAAYDAGRRSTVDLVQWRALVRPHLPAVAPLRVLDLGAGTAIFAAAWPAWGASSVVALDRQAAMLHQARATGLPARVAAVVGAADELPLRSGCVDVAWLSTVIHHFGSAPPWRHELRRVMAPHGRVLVRAFFRDVGRVGWLPHFPGAERVRDQFPSLAETIAGFGATGFSLVAVEDAPVAPVPLDTVCERLLAMRRADTLLAALSDDEFAAGLRALRRSTEPAVSGLLHLVVFRPSGAPPP